MRDTFMVADNPGFPAVLAGLKPVMMREVIPVQPLGGAERSGTAAERTDIPESRQNGAADKLRPVSDTLHGFGEGFVHFKSDRLPFVAPRTHGFSPAKQRNTL
jgi:hypothetical protein